MAVVPARSALWDAEFAEARKSVRMLIEGPFPFIGEITWFRPEESGRRVGVPPVVEGRSYVHLAHVPPRSAVDGSASFVLRGWDPGRWHSPAEGRWLLVDNEGDHRVDPRTIVIVTEGPRAVASFLVTQVRTDLPPVS